MNEPRVYKHSPWNFVGIVFAFGFLLFVFFISKGDWTIILFALIGFGVVTLISLFSFTPKTIISENEISTQNLLWTKTLRWSEVARVSGSGFAIKLHNFDGDVAVAPSPQMPGYEEIVEWIGVKRPDLFNPQEYSEMSRGLLGILVQLFVGLVVIGLGIFAYIDSDGFILPSVFFLVIGLVFMGVVFFSPRSVSIQGNSILIGYLFNQKTLLANEIASVNFDYNKNRNGKNYYVQISPKHGNNIRISILKPSIPIAYHVLKNWHQQYSQISQTTRQN